MNQFNLKYQTSGCADLRIRSAAMARVTGVSGRLARRICKKVLRDGRPDRHHSPFEFVLLTISVIVTIEWGSAAGQIRQAGGTCVDGAPDGDRLLKRLSGAVGLPPNRQIPGVTICPRAPKHRRKKGWSKCVRRATSGRALQVGKVPHRTRRGGLEQTADGVAQ